MAKDSMDLTRWAKDGKFTLLNGVDRKLLQNHRDSEDNSVLSTAALYGHKSSCEKIMEVCSRDLLYVTNNKKSTVLHLAVSDNHTGTLRFLLEASSKDDNSRGKNLLKMQDEDDRTALHIAVEKGHLDSAKILIVQDKNRELLRMTDKNGDTAMHLAVRAQSIKIVELLHKEGPALNYLVNTSGETPHLIAFEKALNGEQASADIRNFLIKKQQALCKAPSGIKNWSLIHHAVDKGDKNAAEEIISECRECLGWVDQDDRNPLHILASKSEYAELGRYILGRREITQAILNKQDKNGDTPLHIAGAIGNNRVAELLLYNPVVNKLIKNNHGQRTFDGIKFPIDRKRAGLLDEKEMIQAIYDSRVKDHANFDLLVSALIATVSFAAGIAVPGGYNSEEPNKGRAVLASKTSFRVFMVSDAIALLLSLYAVLCHFAAKHIEDEHTMLYQVIAARVCSLLAIFAMVAAFASGIYSVLAVTDEFAITLCTICSSFFLFGLLPLSMINKKIRQYILLPVSSYVGEKIKGVSSRTPTKDQDGSSGKQLEDKSGDNPHPVEVIVHTNQETN